MIIKVEGDILLSKAEVVAHGIGAHDHFNQGLAHSLKEKWPALYKDFRHWCKVHNPDAGEVWSWAGPGVKVANLVTQAALEGHQEGCLPGRATEHNINVALKNLRKEIGKNKYKSIAITKIGTGVGGLNWDHVEPLINKHLGDLDIPVYVYEKYVPNKEAKEVH
jgi:O-acetyl-ADP-ribose deacetylase (regulator of RNase III)